VELALSSALQSGAEGNIKADVWLFIIYEENSVWLSILSDLWNMVMGCASSCETTSTLALKVSVMRIWGRSEC